MIPARHFPKARQCHRDRDDWMPALFSQQHRAHLGNVWRPFWTINSERGCASGPHKARHFDYRSDAAARARSPYSAITESLDETRDVLTIEAARGHNHDAAIPPPISGQK